MKIYVADLFGAPNCVGYYEFEVYGPSEILMNQSVFNPENQEDLDSLNVIGKKVPEVKKVLEKLGF